jgi:hypothetical protein
LLIEVGVVMVELVNGGLECEVGVVGRLDGWGRLSVRRDDVECRARQGGVS